MFVSTPNNQVMALNAVTGEMLWRYRRPRPKDVFVLHDTNRGVALYGDKVFYAAACDDYADIFDDSVMYKDILQPFEKWKLQPEELCRAEANVVWDEFRKMPDGARY